MLVQEAYELEFKDSVDPNARRKEEAQNRYDALNAIQAFLQGKNNAFEMAYHGAKKMILSCQADII